jgi:hypothetical protein
VLLFIFSLAERANKRKRWSYLIVMLHKAAIQENKCSSLHILDQLFLDSWFQENLGVTSLSIIIPMMQCKDASDPPIIAMQRTERRTGDHTCCC